MKKVFSLLLAVAMLASMFVFAIAAEPNAAGGMHTVITETDDKITVEVIITNVTQFTGMTSYLMTDDVKLVANSAVKGDKVSGFLLSDGGKTDGIKLGLSTTDASLYFDEAGSFTALTYEVTKVDSSKELSESDFAYGTKSTTASKVTTPAGGTVAGVSGASNAFGTNKTGMIDYFTIKYVDARTPAATPTPTPAPATPTPTPVPEKFVNNTNAVVDGTTITVSGKVGAAWLAQDYGVEFTTNKLGTRAQRYYGAKDGSIVADFNGTGATIVDFDTWDGTFEIVLNNVSAGTKEYKFFVGTNYTDVASVEVK